LAWQDFFQWLPYTGLQMTVHRQLPLHLPRWLGVVRQPGDFQDHCLAMDGMAVLWDPTDLAPEGPPLKVRKWAIHEISIGLSFGLAANR
jgi:hypothetical protein